MHMKIRYPIFKTNLTKFEYRVTDILNTEVRVFFLVSGLLSTVKMGLSLTLRRVEMNTGFCLSKKIH